MPLPTPQVSVILPTSNEWKTWRSWQRLGLAMLGACLLALVVVYLNSRHPWFDLDREQNIPTFFSGLLFCCAGLAAARNVRGAREAGRAAWPWRLLAVALFVAAVDEVVGIHEAVTRLAWSWTGVSHLKNIGMFGYVSGLGIGMWLLKPWWRQFRAWTPVSARLVAGGLACWFASFLFELAVQVYEVVPAPYHRLSIGLEEGLEMFGTLLLLHAFLVVPRQDLQWRGRTAQRHDAPLPGGRE